MGIHMNTSNKQTWEPFELTYVGNVRDVVRGKRGRNEPSAEDAIHADRQDYDEDPVSLNRSLARHITPSN